MSIRSTIMSRRTSIPGGGGIMLDDGPVVPTRNYTVFRGLSPTTASRIENRIKELEDALEAEREIHLRSERELAEVNAQLMSLSERVEETESQLIIEVDQNKKKDYEISKLRKDLELVGIQHETELSNLRKRHQDLINDLNDQLEKANKNKHRSEKDRHQINIEIETLNSSLENSNKARGFAESKLEAAEDQLRRMKPQIDELNRLVTELKSSKDRLTHENADLQKQLRDFEHNSGNISKVKSQLQIELDDARSQADDQARLSSSLEIQLNNMQMDFEKMQGQLEDETDAANDLRSHNQKLTSDYAYLKGKYDKDIGAKGDEVEDYKRKHGSRLQELEGLLEQARHKVSKLEKEKNKITIEVKDLTMQLDESNSIVGDCMKKVKHLEHQNNEWQKRFNDLANEFDAYKHDAEKSHGELARLKALTDDQTSKIDHLTRELHKLQELLKDSEHSNKDLDRSLQEALSLKMNLQNERESLLAELNDAKDFIRDLEARLEGATSQLNVLRLDYDTKLRERDEEVENQRRHGHKHTEELQKTIIEIESKHKSDLGRLKKKYEGENNEYLLQIEGLNHANGELNRNNKGLHSRIREVETIIETERHGGEQAKDAAGNLERKLISLTGELDNLRNQLDIAERARKNAESELGESSSNSQQIHITINTLTAEKKRLESDYMSLQREFDDMVANGRMYESKVDSLQSEVNRLTDQLRSEQERANFNDSGRKGLESQIHELTLRLEDMDHSKDSKRVVEKLKNRLHELEAELDMEQRRSKDISSEIRKYQKQAQDFKVQYEDEHRLNVDLSDQNQVLLNKLNLLNKQIEEQDEVLSITMNKYRKVQDLLEESEKRADRVAESSVSAIRHANTAVGLGAVHSGGFSMGRMPGGFRSVSVSRNLKY